MNSDVGEKKIQTRSNRENYFLPHLPRKQQKILHGVKSANKQDPFSFQAYIKNMTTLQTKELTLQM